MCPGASPEEGISERDEEASLETIHRALCTSLQVR